VAFLVGWPFVPAGVLTLLVGVLCGIYWTLQPAYIARDMNKVTDTDALGYGHTSSLNCWLAAKLGKYVGSPEQSTEDIEMPESLEFFK
jgi:PTS system ascorbate-specific IIC component